MRVHTGAPRLLRTECGTENTNLSFIQPYLGRDHTDCLSGMDSFRYGKSVTNQASLILISLFAILFTENRGMVVTTEQTLHKILARIV